MGHERGVRSWETQGRESYRYRSHGGKGGFRVCAVVGVECSDWLCHVTEDENHPQWAVTREARIAS